MKQINSIDDIYPLTLVRMRFGKYAIIEVFSECDAVSSLQEDEEWQYDPHHFMKEEWEHLNYGVGKTIDLAFQDFKNRYK